MFKPKIFILVIFAVVLLLPKANTAQAREFISIMTCGTAGTYYPLGGGIARIWQTFVPGVNSTAESSGCSVVNLRLMAKGEAQAAICQNDAVYFAHKGLLFFKEKAEKQSRGMNMLYDELLHVAVSKQSGIKKISDLKGKKVRLGTPGSIAVFNNKAVLNAFGLEEKNVVESNMSLSDSFNAMKDGNLDAVIEFTGAPGAGFIDLTTTRDIVFLPVEEPYAKKINKEYPYMSQAVLKKGTYRGLEKDVPVMALSCMLVVNEKLGKDLVYQMTKAFFEHLDVLRDTHAKGKEVSLVNALKGMPIPLHPGAEKYYREKGLIK